jgi:hypothetical protein
LLTKLTLRIYLPPSRTHLTLVSLEQSVIAMSSSIWNNMTKEEVIKLLGEHSPSNRCTQPQLFLPPPYDFTYGFIDEYIKIEKIFY